MVREEIAVLWEARQRGDVTARARLVNAYLYLVKGTLRRLQRLPGAFYDDLEAEGRLALVRAVDRFDPAKGVKFESYAITLIKGAMLEWLRRDDWAPRGVRAAERLGIGRPIELISLDEIIYGDGTSDDVTYLDGLSDWEDTPEVIVPDRIEAEVVRTLVRCLPRAERRVLELYYWQELSYGAIAGTLGLSLSRVGQLRERAEFFLRHSLEATGALTAA